MNLAVRAVLGVVVLAISGLLLRGAAMRFVRGLVMFFGGASAFTVGALLLGSAALGTLRRWRRRRRGAADPAWGSEPAA